MGTPGVALATKLALVSSADLTTNILTADKVALPKEFTACIGQPWLIYFRAVTGMTNLCQVMAR